MIDSNYIIERHTILNDFTCKKDRQEFILNNMARQKEERRIKREIESSKVALQKAIDKTYEDIIALYKKHDIELNANPVLEAALKRSYGSKVGAVVGRRNRLKKELRLLHE